jgi:hypothetical protein
VLVEKCILKSDVRNNGLMRNLGALNSARNTYLLKWRAHHLCGFIQEIRCSVHGELMSNLLTGQSEAASQINNRRSYSVNKYTSRQILTTQLLNGPISHS